MPIIPLECPSCGANLNVNSDYQAALCGSCGKQFVVKDAVFNNYIKNVVTIKADSVNIITHEDFEIVGGELKKYKGSATNVQIPNTVTIIGKGAFENCRGITNVNIPNSVTRIDNSAFIGCETLREIRIPDSVSYIGDCAFSGLKYIKIYWPESWRDKQLSKFLISVASFGELIRILPYISEPYPNRQKDRPYIEPNQILTLYYDGYFCYDYPAGGSNYAHYFFSQLNPAYLAKNNNNNFQTDYAYLAKYLDRAGISREVIQMVTVPKYVYVNSRKGNNYVQKGTQQILSIRLITN